MQRSESTLSLGRVATKVQGARGTSPGPLRRQEAELGGCLPQPRVQPPCGLVAFSLQDWRPARGLGGSPNICNEATVWKLYHYCSFVCRIEGTLRV